MLVNAQNHENTTQRSLTTFCQQTPIYGLN